MLSQPSEEMIDAIRTVSRNLVRDLGFMGGAFAGTNLSPSAVHALIEIERDDLLARDLCDRLRLEKSSVSRMLGKLADTGLIERKKGRDPRERILSLTPQGHRTLQEIHGFAREQVRNALSALPDDAHQSVYNGLRLYSEALSTKPAAPSFEIVDGYTSGLIARVTEMHAQYYAQASGFGQTFESVVARGLADFCGSSCVPPKPDLDRALRRTDSGIHRH